ncbi:hypothetical protein M427DRAFT_36411, partial [Gonapodya prolifera JEL478]
MVTPLILENEVLPLDDLFISDDESVIEARLTTNDTAFFSQAERGRLRKNLQDLHTRRVAMSAASAQTKFKGDVCAPELKELDALVVANVTESIKQENVEGEDVTRRNFVKDRMIIAESELDLEYKAVGHRSGRTSRKGSDILGDFSQSADAFIHDQTRQFAARRASWHVQRLLLDAEARYGRCVWEGQVAIWNTKDSNRTNLGAARIFRPGSAPDVKLDLPLTEPLTYNVTEPLTNLIDLFGPLPKPDVMAPVTCNLLLVPTDPKPGSGLVVEVGRLVNPGKSSSGKTSVPKAALFAIGDQPPWAPGSSETRKPRTQDSKHSALIHAIPISLLDVRGKDKQICVPAVGPGVIEWLTDYPLPPSAILLIAVLNLSYTARAELAPFLNAALPFTRVLAENGMVRVKGAPGAEDSAPGGRWRRASAPVAGGAILSGTAPPSTVPNVASTAGPPRDPRLHIRTQSLGYLPIAAAASPTVMECDPMSPTTDTDRSPDAGSLTERQAPKPAPQRTTEQIISRAHTSLNAARKPKKPSLVQQHQEQIEALEEGDVYGKVKKQRARPTWSGGTGKSTSRAGAYGPPASGTA